MRRSRPPAAEHEIRTLHADLSHAISKARRRRGILLWMLVVGALVLAACLLIFGSPI